MEVDDVGIETGEELDEEVLVGDVGELIAEIVERRAADDEV